VRVAEKVSAKFERGSPDEGKGQRIAHGGAESRGDDVAADQERDDGGDDEVKTDERREGSKYAGRDAGRDGMGRCRQPQDALGEIQGRTREGATRPQGRADSVTKIRRSPLPE